MAPIATVCGEQKNNSTTSTTEMLSTTSNNGKSFLIFIIISYLFRYCIRNVSVIILSDTKMGHMWWISNEEISSLTATKGDYLDVVAKTDLQCFSLNLPSVSSLLNFAFEIF